MNNNEITSPLMSKAWQCFFKVFMFVPLLMISFELDNDIWFLLNSGRYVMQNGFPFTEPFSIHEGMSFVMQQWLSAVIFWLCYSVFGKVCLLIVVALTFAAIIFILYRLCMLVSEGNFLVSFGVTVITAAYMSYFYRTRPYIFTVLILAVLIFALEKYARTKSVKWLILLPFLSVLLINLHASMWMMFFVLMLPFFVDAFKFRVLFVRGEGYSKLPLVVAAVISAAAGFINPCGIDAMTYLLRSYGHQEISKVVGEMYPPNIMTSVGIMIFSSFLVVVLIYCLYRKGETKLRYFLLTLGTAFLTLSNVRSYILFLLCATFPLAYYLKDLKQNEKQTEAKTKTESSKQKTRIILVSLICILLIGIIPIRMLKQDESAGLPECRHAVDFLLKNTDSEKVRLYTGYNDGDYAQYMGFKTYIDARAEVYCIENNGKADIMQEYYDMEMGNVNYRHVLAKYNFTHLLVNPGDILYIYLEDDDGYKKIYDDNVYKIFVPVT